MVETLAKLDRTRGTSVFLTSMCMTTPTLFTASLVEMECLVAVVDTHVTAQKQDGCNQLTHKRVRLAPTPVLAEIPACEIRTAATFARLTNSFPVLDIRMIITMGKYSGEDAYSTI